MTGLPHGLRIEHLDEPLGLLTRSPRMSWRLPAGASLQLGYRIRTDNGWDTGWVSDDRHLLVPYAGPALRSAQRVTWRVQVDTDLGRSEWSEPAGFETGLLDDGDWTAAWIEPGRMPDGPPGRRPAAMLRIEFDVPRPVVAAR